MLQRRQGLAKVLGNLPEVLAVSDQGGAQLQQFVGQEAVGRNGQQERLRGGDQTQRALGVVVLHELAGDAHEQARRIEALVCHRQHAGQRLVEVIARGLEVEDELRSPGGEKLQLGEERRVVHRIDQLDGKFLIQHGRDRLIVSCRYFNERQQQEAVGRGRRLQFGRRHGAQGIIGQSRDVARAVEVQENHADACRALEGRLSLGSGRGLERAFRQLDRIDIAAGEDEVGDIPLLSAGLPGRGDQAQGNGEGSQPASCKPAAAHRHGLSVSR